MIDKIKCKNKIGNDIHKELIAMFNKLQEGWEPPLHILEEEYNNTRINKNNLPDYYVGFIGFNGSFGSKYWGGYARGFKADGITPRNIPNEAIRNLMTQIPKLKDVEFINRDYLEFDKSKFDNWLIYCDPPYQNTTKYATNNFDYEKFWDWVREVSKNNYVFVSEYNAPDDFKCLWHKGVTTSLKVHEHKNRVERLFTYTAA